jgi:hypothetical protein
MSSNGGFAQITTTLSTAASYLLDDPMASFISKPLSDEIELYHHHFSHHHHHHHLDSSSEIDHSVSAPQLPAQSSVILIVNEDGTTSTAAIKTLSDENTGPCLMVNDEHDDSHRLVSKNNTHEEVTGNEGLTHSPQSHNPYKSASSNHNEGEAEDAADEEEEEQQHEQVNPNKYRQFVSASSSIVPTMTNVEDVFLLLSQKIAKYCQILTDLTNCEVFYKAQLPISEQKSPATTTTAVGQQLTEQTEAKRSSSAYKPKNVVNKNIRSLYWGTHKMLFQHSHGDGLKYEKRNGDSLIKIANRSLSNDITSLIEELLNMNEPTSSSCATTMITKTDSTTNSGSKKQQPSGKKLKN